jgi:hypothetical protein
MVVPVLHASPLRAVKPTRIAKGPKIFAKVESIFKIGAAKYPAMVVFELQDIDAFFL